MVIVPRVVVCRVLCHTESVELLYFVYFPRGRPPHLRLHVIAVKQADAPAP